MSASRPYTPKILAAEWQCSERHIRNLINSGKLAAFRLGDRLLRIPPSAVEQYLCKNIVSDGLRAGSSSAHTTTPETGPTVTALTPEIRARLNAPRLLERLFCNFENHLLNQFSDTQREAYLAGELDARPGHAVVGH
jgi:excisionase family DNA binding protein